MNWIRYMFKRLLFAIMAMISMYSSGYGQVVLKNQGIITVVQGTRLSVNGDFKQSTDNLNAIDSGAVIDLQGNMFNEGNGGFTDGATGSLIIHGDSINSPNAHVTLRNLILDQTAQKDSLQMNGIVNIKDQLTFINGALNIKNDSLLLTEQNISGNTKGRLVDESKDKPLVASQPGGVVVAQDDFVYTSADLGSPINKGNLGFTSLFGNGGAGGKIMVTRNPNPSTPLPNGSIKRLYQFETTNNEKGGIVTFSYFDTELGAFAGKEAYLQLFHSIDNGLTWSIVPAALDTALNTATSSPVTNMTGFWTLSDCDAPSITIASNDVACQNGTVSVESSISPTGTYTYQWFADGILLDGETNSTIVQEVSDQNIIMTLELTTDLGCTVPAYDTLVPVALPLVALEESILKCADINATLDAGATFLSYAWSNENGDLLGTNRTIDVLQEGAYTLTVTDTTTCANSDTISVINYDPANLDRFYEKIGTCESSIVLGEDLAIDNPGSTFVWSNDKGETESGSMYTVLIDGDYTVEITSPNNCITTATTNVALNTSNFANLGEDVSIACQSITLDAVYEGANYLWSDGSTDKTLEINKSGLYWVEIEVSPTCIGRDSIQIELLPALDSAFFLAATEGLVNDTLFFIGLVNTPTTSILWDFDDGSTKKDDLFPFNLYAFTGDYDPSLTTIFENGCVSSYSKRIVIIEEQANAGGRIAYEEALFQDVTIYPNPNDGRFNVEVELSQPSALSIRLTQITPSRMIDHIQIRDADTHFFKEFDYSYLSTGVYQMIIEAQDQIKAYRIVVMK